MIRTCILTVSMVAFLASCQQGKDRNSDAQRENAFDETAETAAIMKVIEGETTCFFDGDYACWASHWSHKPTAMQAWNNSDGTADVAMGWEEINAQGKDWIEKYYKNGEVVIHPVVKKEKPVVTFFNDTTAYLNWKQYNADQEKKYYTISQEMRILEKEETWKIHTVAAFWSTEEKIAFDSLRLE